MNLKVLRVIKSLGIQLTNIVVLKKSWDDLVLTIYRILKSTLKVKICNLPSFSLNYICNKSRLKLVN
jgi:hypothetical protein